MVRRVEHGQRRGVLQLLRVYGELLLEAVHLNVHLHSHRSLRIRNARPGRGRERGSTRASQSQIHSQNRRMLSPKTLTSDVFDRDLTLTY